MTSDIHTQKQVLQKLFRYPEGILLEEPSRPPVSLPIETLGPHRKTRVIPVEEADDIAPTVHKDEKRPCKHILSHLRLDDSAKTVPVFAHIHRMTTQVDLREFIQRLQGISSPSER